MASSLYPLAILGVAAIAVLLPVAASYWVEAPVSPTHRDYTTAVDFDRPQCPPKHEPSFWGVVVIDGKSRPVYQCHPGATDQGKYRWESLESPSPSAEPS